MRCVDWSCDNKLLKSNCGAYELLYWDVALGKQILSSLDTIEADALWQTKTCVLGFEVGCLKFKIVSSNKLTTPDCFCISGYGHLAARIRWHRCQLRGCQQWRRDSKCRTSIFW
jgi:hypothetical protein